MIGEGSDARLVCCWAPTQISIDNCWRWVPAKKVKVAHTRLPSIGFRSWSRYFAVSLQVTWVINPALGCHYFPPGLQLPPQPLRWLLPVLLFGEQRHNGCAQFASKTVTRQRRDCDLTRALLRLSPARWPLGYDSTGYQSISAACAASELRLRLRNKLQCIIANTLRTANVAASIIFFAGLYCFTVTRQWGTKVCRYKWHSAGSLGWPLPMLKHKYIFSNKIYGIDYIKQHSETVTVWNYQNVDCSLKNKFIVSFIIIFGTLSFPMRRSFLVSGEPASVLLHWVLSIYWTTCNKRTCKSWL